MEISRTQIAPLEIDPNKIAAEFLQANLDKALSLGSAQLKGARNLLRSRLERTYNTYIRRLLERHSKAKSFFVRTEPIPLYEFFVPLDVATDRQRIQSANAASLAAVAPFAILTGSGGSGKSMVMKHLLLSALLSREKTPLFLELRQLDLSNRSLEDALLASLVANGLDVDEDYFLLALAAGHFLILLDGFDELDRRARAKVTTAVQALSEKHPGNWIVLSSRPDPELEGWTAFTVFRLEPLDLEKAVALVERLSFDEEVKSRFVKDLRADLFRRHQSFLSNPLLLSIMLLTYHDTAHIPSKLSIFYNQAYESLFQKHDALKGGFQRQRLTTLDIQDFARVFAAFCLRTYNKRLFTFSLTTALEEFERCRDLTRLPFAPADFVRDAQQAVCLLVEEGADLAFAHRSFQEYFAARYIAQSPPQTKAQLIRRFSGSVGADAVIPLLHEIDPFAVEQHFVLPTLQRLRTQIGLKRLVGVTHHKRYLGNLFGTFQVTSGPSNQFGATIDDIAMFQALTFIHTAYAPTVLGRVLKVDQAWNPDDVADLLAERFSVGEQVPVYSIVRDLQIMNNLRGSPGIFGMQYLRDLFEIDAEIRMRHSASEGSLETILG